MTAGPPVDRRPPPRPPWVLPKAAYTPWWRRFCAALVDWVPVAAFLAAPAVYLVVERLSCDDFRYDLGPGTRNYEYYCTGASTHVGIALTVGGVLLAIGCFLWNLCHRQGKSGQSIGKSLLGFRCVGEKTWQPVGFGQSLGRQAAHYLDYTLVFIGYLLPLWDPKRQTIADKIMGTVCVPAERATAADARRPLRPVLAVSGVVASFLVVCGVFLAIGNGAGPVIGTAAHTGSIGEPAGDGNLQFVVMIFGKASQQSDPAGEFVVAVVSVTNTSAQPQSLAVGDQYAIDTFGRRYPAVDVAVVPGSRPPTTVLNVLPGSVKAAMRFDVAKGIRVAAVEFHESPSSTGATIRLN